MTVQGLGRMCQTTVSETFTLVSPFRSTATLPPRAEWVLIVAGGILQEPAVRAARELGYKVLLTDRNPDCHCAALADEFVQLDTYDVRGHVRLAESWRGALAAVFTAGADPIVTVASAAEAAGCHGLTVYKAEICADKEWTRFELEIVHGGYDVPQPDYIIINDEQNLFEQRYCDKFDGKPFIVKATGASGSRGHTRIGTERTFGEVKAAYRKAREHSVGKTVLFEELLTGVELSVETLWYNGEMIPLNAVERPFLPDTCIELGHYNPWLGSADEYAAVWDVVRKAGLAVGMGAERGGHIFKADLMLTDEGPKVLELTARLSGGFDSGWTSPLAHGTNYTRGALRLALGQSLERAMPDFVPRWHRHAACWAVFGPAGGGIIKEVVSPDRAADLGQIVVRYGAGDVLSPLVDCTQRVAFCIAVDDAPAGARATARAMVDAIGVVVE
jgi:biotin carboxylase